MTAMNIARCPEHGLHGEREECFICGGPVDQVAMVPAAECWTAVSALAWAVGLISVLDPGSRTYAQRTLEQLLERHGGET